MRFTVLGKFERHRRNFEIDADCLDCARDKALSLAKCYESNSGVYGPMVWRYGELTLRTFDGESTVIRPLRPMLRLVEPRE